MKNSRFTIVFFVLLSTSVFSQVISLSGSWKFHIDDKSVWGLADFDDSGWEDIDAPGLWEDQGFNGYDGFAWYRKKFDGRKLDKNENYYLGLGYIDDTDQVFVNGTLIGFSGSMPPKFKTAYNSERRYNLPNGVINFDGENIIAIRVFDAMHGGGMIDGKLGVFRSQRNKYLLIDLQGIWWFAKTNWKGELIRSESEWIKLMVPGPWEHQGYPRYDGFAWYKRTFTLPANFTQESLVLMLGKIDDFDKVYLNGKLIGTTNDQQPYGRSESFMEDRTYTIPAQVVKRGGVNTIEVLVEDMGNIGGIYEGTIGITTRANYEKYFR